MNNWVVSGRLGRDPSINQVPSGDMVVNFSMAISRRVKKGNDYVEEPIWIDVSLFGRRAQWIHDHCGKGTLVEAQGQLNVREYKTKEGLPRTAVELVAYHVNPLDRFENRFKGAAAQQQQTDGGRTQHRDDFRGGSTRGGSSYGQQSREQKSSGDDYGSYDPNDDIPF